MSVGQRPVLAQFDARTDSFDTIWDEYSRTGAAIVHHMLESETVARLREELAVATRSTSAGTKSTDSMVQKFWAPKPSDLPDSHLGRRPSVTKSSSMRSCDNLRIEKFFHIAPRTG